MSYDELSNTEADDLTVALLTNRASVRRLVERLVADCVAETRKEIAEEIAALVRTPPGVGLSETTRTYMHAHSIVMQEGKALSDMPTVMPG